jgi:HlyD family secretion protein
MASNLFRKVSLERLSSPEQLDLLMPVTGPLAWLALLSGVILLSVATYWGFKGEIETRVDGQGILIRRESLHDVISIGTGRIEELLVKVDDEIRQGQLIAVLSQPELELQIREVENQLSLLQSDLNLAMAYGVKSEQLKLQYIAEQRQSLEEAIRADEQRLEFVRKQLEDRKRLFIEGLMTTIQVQETANEYERILQQIREHRTQFANLSAQVVDLASQKEKETVSIEARISQERERLRALKAMLQLQSRILSTSTGRVLELFASVGRVIQTGEPLLTVEMSVEASETLSAVLYFPARDGKKVQTGMEAQVSPSVARQEEYGSILGTVTQVSAFPASSRGMMRVLQNADLVQRLSSGGAPIVVYASLSLDPNTVSGYKWSSGLGPPVDIVSGTLCYSGVVVQRQRPIDLVVPYLKRNLLGEGEDIVQIEEKQRSPGK